MFFLYLPFFAFLAAIPPLRYGIWVDSEPINIALSFLSIFVSISLFVEIRKNENLNLGQLVFLGFLGFFLIYGGILAPFVSDPFLHWGGLPQTFEGVWFYGLFFLLGFCFLTQKKLQPFFYVAFISSCLLGVLTIYNHTPHGFGLFPEWCPFVFSSFLAINGVCLWAYSPFIKNPFRQWFYALGGLLILFSFNKTAIVVAFCCAPFLFLIQRFFSKYQRIVFISVVLMAPFIIALVEYCLASYVFSLGSRVNQLHIVVLEFLSHPFRLLTGFGFGHFVDAMLIHLTELPIDIYQHGAPNPNWDGVERIDFHSHHQTLELLMSLGIFGALGWLILTVLPLVFCSNQLLVPCTIFSLLFTSITSMWFTLPMHLPFLALAYAAFLKDSAREYMVWKGAKFLPVILCSFFMIITPMFWKRAVLFSGTVNSWISQKIGHAVLTPPTLKKEGHGEGIHLATYLDMMKSHLRQNSFHDDILETYEICMLAAESVKKPSLMTKIALLNAYSTLFQYDAETDALIQKWHKMVLDVLETTPTRSDLVAPYLSQLALDGEWENFLKIINEIKNPQDLIKLWFLGLMYFHQSHQQQGISYMKKALDLGVGRWIPIDQNLEAMLHPKSQDTFLK